MVQGSFVRADVIRAIFVDGKECFLVSILQILVDTHVLRPHFLYFKLLIRLNIHSRLILITLSQSHQAHC